MCISITVCLVKAKGDHLQQKYNLSSHIPFLLCYRYPVAAVERNWRHRTGHWRLVLQYIWILALAWQGIHRVEDTSWTYGTDWDSISFVIRHVWLFTINSNYVNDAVSGQATSRNRGWHEVYGGTSTIFGQSLEKICVEKKTALSWHWSTGLNWSVPAWTSLDWIIPCIVSRRIGLQQDWTLTVTTFPSGVCDRGHPGPGLSENDLLTPKKFLSLKWWHDKVLISAEFSKKI